MSVTDNPRRRYHAPEREAAARRRREATIRAAKESFEKWGWGGTTIRAISESAGVSPKTVEAVFGTKAALLRAAVDYAIRGDIEALPMPQRETVKRMEAAPHAPTMLALHASHLRMINARSARIAWVVEHAAPAHDAVADLWREMNSNRAYAVRWAAETLLSKRGRRRGLRRKHVEATFWVAIDWGTFRTLTEHAGLDLDEFEAWLGRYYEHSFLPFEG